MGFSKILIANRGEIACRIQRSAQALGYATVAVYSDADAGALHVALADEAVRIGPAEARESYLNGGAILAAAARSGADAVHPGYGFLSEDAGFAEACEGAGLVFIGPPSAAIRAMGNKAAAKRLMLAAGVPCVPGYQGPDGSDARLTEEARRIGFPVMVKAAAGGGGRGMRWVASADGLAGALAGARSEALNAFGSGELILEKAVAGARHVEIQVFADGTGHTISLGERDCSIQRRHQKVIEEAPSPAVTPDLRKRMGATAVAAARAIGYRGAGTVEFLLAPTGEFYFLEMNTRLQVEHPVTEAVTGLDLVAWQMRVAAGEPLPSAGAPAFSGHAIEARLYAEDPHEGFLPQSGTVLAWRAPWGEGIRVDHGLQAGQEVSAHYDPLLAKIVAHGGSREEARRRLIGALAGTVVLGIPTNRAFLLAALRHAAFAEGTADTGFIGRYFPAGSAALDRPEPDEGMLALAAALLHEAEAAALPSHGTLHGWRSAGSASWPMRLAHGEVHEALTLAPAGSGRYEARLGERRVAVEIVARSPGSVRFTHDGLQRSAHWAFANGTLHLAVGDCTADFRDTLRERHAGAAGDGEARVLAPMNGRIVAVLAAAGDRVAKGQRLLVLEAMKMQHELTAGRAGVVERIAVQVGDQVATRQVLAVLAEDAARS